MVYRLPNQNSNYPQPHTTHLQPTPNTPLPRQYSAVVQTWTALPGFHVPLSIILWYRTQRVTGHPQTHLQTTTCMAIPHAQVLRYLAQRYGMRPTT